MKLHYSATYTHRGHRVRIVPGAKIRRVSDRGTMDGRMIDVEVIETDSTCRAGIRYGVLVDQLEREAR